MKKSIESPHFTVIDLEIVIFQMVFYQ